MKKRILSIVLAICLVLSCVPITVFAAGAGNPYIYKEGTAGAAESESPASLIDGNTGTKWCVTGFSSAYIIFETSSAVNVSGYSITTGNDNAENKGRNPKNWKLYGCNDYTGSGTGTWEEIHSVSNDTVLEDKNNTKYNFAFDRTETAYQYYMLKITAVQSGDVMQMSEFELTSCDHNWGEPVTTSPTCTSAGYTTRTCSVCGGIDYVYLKPVDHDFTESGACIYCHHTKEALSQGYVDEYGISRTLNENTTEITASSTELSGGWYIVRNNVSIEGNVAISGDVNLVLADGCNLKVNGDITEGRLTIYGQSGGTGTLDVTGRITGGYGEGRTGVGGGNITIKGGVVKAESITGGTGGDGFVVEGNPPTFYNGSVGGDITISGGVVEARSITGGKGGNSQGGTGARGGNITIRGGVVKAESIAGGIGGIDPRDGGGGGSVAITGGVVDATSITGGYGNGSIGKDGSVDITGGIVFQSDDGQVHGTDVTLNKSFTISEGKTLTIGSDNNLIIPDGVILTNNGIITNNGKIYVDGTFTGTADNLYYPLTIVDATASGDTSEHNSKNYGKSGSTITLTPDTPSTGYKFCGWDVSPANTVTMVGDNTYTITMPREALTITAQYKEITVPVISGIENGKTYCSSQTVTVTDNDSIQSVTVNGLAIDLVNNQFTLNPAEGTQTIVVTDKAGNETSVTVTVNDGHTAGNDDGDCSTPVYCIYHPDTVVVAAKSHDFSGEWHNDGTGHWHVCQNDGCTISETETPHSGTDDGDCTTAVICECGYVITAANAEHSYGEWQSKGDGTHTRYCTVDGCSGYEDGNCEGGQASYFNKAVCDTCHAEYGALLTDSTAPTGEITVGTNKWNSFLNTITFGLFFKDTQSVTVTAADDSYDHDGYTDDKAVKVAYYLHSGDTVLTKEDLASKEFTIYDGGFNINPDNKYVVYARLTDHAGNVTYISSNGIVLDSVVPVISGIENGKTYCEEQTFTVSEKYIKSVTVNGTEVTLDENNQFTLSPAEGTQTIVITDKAGNVSAETTVTVNDGHTAGNDDGNCSTPVYCIYHPDTVVVAAKSHDFSGEWQKNGTDHWHICQNDGCTVAETETPHSCTDDGDCTTAVVCECGYVITAANAKHTYGEWQSNSDDTHTRYCTVEGCNGYEDGNCAGGEATCVAKAVCDTCKAEYGEIDSANHNLEKIPAKDATVTETGNTEYWHCQDCGKYFADENGTKEIKLEDTIISKLSPEIIEGKGQSITAGEKKELIFKSNAAFSDFIRVELDGKNLDAKNYTVKEGSTVVTLKADYVATLSAGEHTIGIVSESGTATTTFTVNAKAVVDNDTKSPQTGDNSHMALWIALLFMSGAGVIGTMVYGKKKRAK